MHNQQINAACQENAFFCEDGRFVVSWFAFWELLAAA